MTAKVCIVLLMMLMASWAHAAVPIDSSRLVDRSLFVFVADVVAFGEAPEEFPDSVPRGGCFTVRIRQVLKAPEGHRSIAAREVKVVVPPRLGSPLGAVLLFTNPLVFSREILHRAYHFEEASEGRVVEIASLIQEAPQRRLRERVAASQVIAIGTVTQIGAPRTVGFEREHDPRWSVAEISVSDWIKTEQRPVTARTVQVIFPASQDIAWQGFPRPRLGQTATWLLQSIPGHAASGHAALFVPTSEHVRPVRDALRIRAIAAGRAP